LCECDFLKHVLKRGTQKQAGASEQSAAKRPVSYAQAFQATGSLIDVGDIALDDHSFVDSTPNTQD